MHVKTFIEQQLISHLQPEYVNVVDESHMHNVPDGAQSHFKVTIVTTEFAGERLITRHRRVNGLLADALSGPVHALALHTFTPDEWQRRSEEASRSPACLGGSQ